MLKHQLKKFVTDKSSIFSFLNDLVSRTRESGRGGVFTNQLTATLRSFVGARRVSHMTFSVTTLSVMTFSIMTLSTMTLSIMALSVYVIRHKWHSAWQHTTIMPTVNMLSVLMLSVKFYILFWHPFLSLRSYNSKKLALIDQGPYSQHFNFFITYEWVQWARVNVPDKSCQPNLM